MFNLSNVVEKDTAFYETRSLRAEAAPIIDALTKYGYAPAIIGGVLRVEQLGGATKDIDVALRITAPHVSNCRRFMEKHGYVLVHAQRSRYAFREGFLGDYRKGNVNVIMYNAHIYTSLAKLVDSFDLNINKFYEENGSLYNQSFDGVTVQYTPNPLHIPKPARVARFRKEYPELNWSRVPYILETLDD